MVFLAVNKNLGSLSKLESITKFQVLKPDWDGHDSLWNIVMDSPRQSVFKSAMALLIRLYSQDRMSQACAKQVRTNELGHHVGVW